MNVIILLVSLYKREEKYVIVEGMQCKARNRIDFKECSKSTANVAFQLDSL